MRIIAGDAKGRRILSPVSNDTRPTSDRVKESLFNILGGLVPDANVLDLFGGTGNLGLEAISRGASHCIFIDSSRNSIKVIHENLRMLKYEGYSEVYHNDALSALEVLTRREIKFNIIFVDPPYHKDLIPEVLEKIPPVLAEGGIIAAEHDTKDILPEATKYLKACKISKYGDTAITFYKKMGE